MKLLFLFSLALITVEAQAFRFSPMTAEFLASGDKSSETFTVENTDPKRIALEIELTTREVAVDGTETRKSNQDFTIFPQQLSLNPGEKRNIRVSYIGNKKIDVEKSYRLIVSQLNIDFERPKPQNSNSAAVNFLLQYIASLYAEPDFAKAKIALESWKLLPGSKIEFLLKNSGTKHRLLNDAKIRFNFTDKNKKRQIWEPKAEELKNILSENILAGASRSFILKAPQDFAKDLSAEIAF